MVDLVRLGLPEKSEPGDLDDGKENGHVFVPLGPFFPRPSSNPGDDPSRVFRERSQSVKICLKFYPPYHF